MHNSNVVFQTVLKNKLFSTYNKQNSSCGEGGAEAQYDHV